MSENAVSKTERLQVRQGGGFILMILLHSLQKLLKFTLVSIPVHAVIVIDNFFKHTIFNREIFNHQNFNHIQVEFNNQPPQSTSRVTPTLDIANSQPPPVDQQGNADSGHYGNTQPQTRGGSNVQAVHGAGVQGSTTVGFGVVANQQRADTSGELEIEKS